MEKDSIKIAEKILEQAWYEGKAIQEAQENKWLEEYEEWMLFREDNCHEG